METQEKHRHNLSDIFSCVLRIVTVLCTTPELSRISISNVKATCTMVVFKMLPINSKNMNILQTQHPQAVPSTASTEGFIGINLDFLEIKYMFSEPNGKAY